MGSLASSEDTSFGPWLPESPTRYRRPACKSQETEGQDEPFLEDVVEMIRSSREVAT